ncbi:hypothetical protein [Burkholderia ubonensis]|uniref:hypothetical protein n=1 Tax=Burkholderia ubonensis TaxID=101571 RepID=UPI0007586506|nr:hypothetical protein [Burkholderia ubonensis]KVC81391.1 hypothetical protein WI75_08550 [Burkholderia ubonensis]
MPFNAYTFTSAQLVDIRRFCWYPAYGDGAVVFPYPWIMKQYLALEYRLQHISTDEGAVVVNTYLTNLYTLESAIPATGANLDTDQAAVWKHNKNEQADRDRLFDSWRMRLCAFLGVPPGPMRTQSNALVV